MPGWEHAQVPADIDEGATLVDQLDLDLVADADPSDRNILDRRFRYRGRLVTGQSGEVDDRQAIVLHRHVVQHVREAQQLKLAQNPVGGYPGSFRALGLNRLNRVIDMRL